MSTPPNLLGSPRLSGSSSDAARAMLLLPEVSDFLALELDAVHTSFNGCERP